MRSLLPILLLGGGIAAIFVALDNSPTRPAERSLSGIVEDEEGPVPHAIVQFQGDRTFTTTDSQGRFRLPRPSAKTRITAAAEGYRIAGIPSDQQPLRIHLERITAEDCTRYAWVDPTPNRNAVGNCGNCHQTIYDEWHRSAHGHSATNPRFRNLYDGSDVRGGKDVGWNLLKQHPDGAGVCASCHGPTLPTAEFDLRKAVQHVPSGLSSVHCDFCHKVIGPGPGEFGIAHGRYQLDLRRPDLTREEQLFFGPLADVDRGDDSFSRFQRDSRFCAACHEGNVFGIPVYTTYSEWLASLAKRRGQSCQSCHMAPTGRLTNMAPGHGGIERNPQTLANHRFFDGSHREMLRRAIQLEGRAISTAEGVSVEVAITTSGVGHRVPTGFVDRHLVLQVVHDQPPIRGPTLPPSVGPALTGKAGVLYAKILHHRNGQTPVPFWEADPNRIVDTRLQPDSTDRNTWLFPHTTKPIHVRLLYRRFWDETVRSKGWSGTEWLIAETAIAVPSK